MTVRELIERLDIMPPDAHVEVRDEGAKESFRVEGVTNVPSPLKRIWIRVRPALFLLALLLVGCRTSSSLGSDGASYPEYNAWWR